MGATFSWGAGLGLDSRSKPDLGVLLRIIHFDEGNVLGLNTDRPALGVSDPAHPTVLHRALDLLLEGLAIIDIELDELVRV